MSQPPKFHLVIITEAEDGMLLFHFFDHSLPKGEPVACAQCSRDAALALYSQLGAVLNAGSDAG